MTRYGPPRIARWLLASFCVLFALVGAFFVYQYKPGQGAVDELPFTETLQKAVDIRLEWSSKNADLALLVFAALWGLVLAGKEDVRLSKSDLPEWLMFLSANALLAGAFVVHQRYADAVATSLVWAVRHAPPAQPGQDGTMNVPDLFGGMYEQTHGLQLSLSCLGIFSTVITLVSAAYLKRNE